MKKSAAGAQLHLHFLLQRTDLPAFLDLPTFIFGFLVPKIGSRTVATTLPTKLVIDAIILSLLCLTLGC
jgi:hypothetical protein